MLDPPPVVPISKEFLALVDFVKPNAQEAEVLTGMRVHDRDSARKAARELINRGVGAVAMQAGEEGNLLVWRDGEHFLPRIKVAAVDATGAGDAFAGALATYISRGRSFVEAGTECGRGSQDDEDRSANRAPARIRNSGVLSKNT